MICGNCMTQGTPGRRSKVAGDGGAGALTVILGLLGFAFPPLWLGAVFFFVCGVILAVVNRATASVTYRCRSCKAEAMVPLDSPRGAELLARIETPAASGWQRVQ